MPPDGVGTARGLTESERYLVRICEQSFLTLWSHPNLFKKVNQELCDLLVVFGEDIVVFSDKSCAFQPGPHGWSRWYRSAILDSAHQLHRAAGWLRKHPSNVFLDVHCTQRYPFALPRSPRIHLVAVAVGAREACMSHFKGGLGSLSFAPEANGKEPFEVGDIDPAKEFVHVFDEVTLDIVLRELDTVADFVAYLRAKVDFLRSGRIGYIAGEENLVAYYCMNNRTVPVPPELPADRRAAIDGAWDMFVNDERYRAQKAHNEISYLWDQIIERITSALISRELDPIGDMDLPAGERCLRLLARESRLSRRGLAFSLARFMGQADKQDYGHNTARLMERPDEAYVFVACARWPDADDLEYRRARQALLEARCTVVKGESPHLRGIVGLAFAVPRDGDPTIDFVVDTYDRDWTTEEIESTYRLREQLGWEPLDELEVIRDGFADFPPSDRRVPKPKFDAAVKRKAKRKSARAARKRHRR